MPLARKQESMLSTSLELRRLQRLSARYRAAARGLRKTIKRLVQDNDDMQESRCTSFVRCPKCKHLHDTNYICPGCGWDHTHPLEEEE